MGGPLVTKTLGRMVAVASAVLLALLVPRTAFADMGHPDGWGMLQDPSVRPTLLPVIILATVIAAAGLIGLWRMSIRSAAIEAAGPEGDAQ
jgi:hypothetical protein